MGEKHLQSFLKLIDNLKNDEINLQFYNSNILSFILKNKIKKEFINSFIKTLEAINNGTIVAYSRDIDEERCEVYIRL